jgi:hypothetical protein
VCTAAVLYNQRLYYSIDKKILSRGGTGRKEKENKTVCCIYFSVAKGVAKANNNS